MRSMLSALCTFAACALGAAPDPWVVYDGFDGPGKGKRVVLVSGDEEYRSEEAMTQLGRILAKHHGFTCTVQHMDPRVGGTFKMSFHNFSTGDGHSFGGAYEELVPGELIRYTDRFDDPNLPGTMQVTVSLRPVSCGTELDIVQEGIPAVIPVEACHLGWQESLALLAQLVEAEIPG